MRKIVSLLRHLPHDAAIRRELDPEWWWWRPELHYTAAQLEISSAHLVAYLSAHGVKGVKAPQFPRPGEPTSDGDAPSQSEEVQSFFRR